MKRLSFSLSKLSIALISVCTLSNHAYAVSIDANGNLVSSNGIILIDDNGNGSFESIRSTDLSSDIIYAQTEIQTSSVFSGYTETSTLSTQDIIINGDYISTSLLKDLPVINDTVNSLTQKISNLDTTVNTSNLSATQANIETIISTDIETENLSAFDIYNYYIQSTDVNTQFLRADLSELKTVDANSITSTKIESESIKSNSINTTNLTVSGDISAKNLKTQSLTINGTDVGQTINSLDNKVTTEVARIDNNAATEQTRVNNEISRIDVKVNTEVSRIDTNVATLDNKVTTEVARIDSTAATEKTRVNGEIARIDTTAAALDSKVTTEVARIDSTAATEKTRVNGEIARIDTTTTTLTNKVSAVETSTAQMSTKVDTVVASNAAISTKVDGVVASSNILSAKFDTEVTRLDSMISNSYKNLSHRVDNVEKTANRGVAISLAAQQAVPNLAPGRSAVYAGVGHYEGESAGAAGFATLMEDGKTSFGAAIGVAGAGQVGGRVGVSYTFD